MKNPKISVVTVCYNAVAEMENTILSVVNQSYSNIEYISQEDKKGWATGNIDSNYGYFHDGCFTPICQILFFIFSFLFINIFYIIYVNRIQKKLGILFVNIANKSLFGLVAINIIFSFLIRAGIHVYCLLFYIIIHILYEILIIVKMFIIGEFYFNDIFFIINNFIYFFYVKGVYL